MPNNLSKIIEIYNPDVKLDNIKHIAVIVGGMSAEREVSLNSAQAVVNALKTLNYKLTIIDMGRDIAVILSQVNPDMVFNCLHGTYGEDGCLPGLLEIMGIPYTHSGVLASSVSMDKIKSQNLFMANGIKCAESVIISKHNPPVTDPMPRPYVIKPVNQGSSIGVYVIFEEDEFDIQNYDFAYGDLALVERYIAGQELQVAIVNNEALAVLEIVTKNRFYDYEAKYTDGVSKHILPARLSEKAYKKALELAQKAHDIMGCRSMSRVEFRYDPNEGEDGTFYILEINTHPGMTDLSIVPEIAAYKGISFPQLMESLINDAGLCNEACK